MWNKPRYCWQLQIHDWIQNFHRSNKKWPCSGKLNISSWFYDMESDAKKSMERYCQWPTRRLNNSTKYKIHALTTITSKKNWNPWVNCQRYAFKLFWNTNTWHVVEVTIFYGQWTNLHDQWQNGPRPVTNAWIDWFHIFIILVNTNNIVMWEILPNNADWDCFKTHLEDSKSTSGGTLCVFGSHTFVPISGMCKKQTAVSHSSTESEIISLDTGLRMDGLPALELWDLIVSVLGNVSRVSDRSGNLIMMFINVISLRAESMWWKTLIWFLQMSNPQIMKLYCMCLKTMKPWLRWSWKEGVQQWGMFPELTELHLIGCSIELIWTPNCSSYMWVQTILFCGKDSGVEHNRSRKQNQRWSRKQGRRA